MNITLTHLLCNEVETHHHLRQVVMKPPCLDVVDDGICDCAVNRIIKKTAHCVVFKNQRMDRITVSPGDVYFGLHLL